MVNRAFAVGSSLRWIGEILSGSKQYGAFLFLAGCQVSLELADRVIESDFRGSRTEKVAGVSPESEGLPQFAQGSSPGFPFIEWYIFVVVSTAELERRSMESAHAAS